MSATCDTIALRKDAQLTDADFDVLGDILQCTICYSEYSDSPGALPRSLPCGHTFCTSCLETFYRSVPDCDSLAIECPTCRKRHYMPLPSGIDVVASPVAASFPINFCVKEMCGRIRMVILDRVKYKKALDATEHEIALVRSKNDHLLRCTSSLDSEVTEGAVKHVEPQATRAIDFATEWLDEDGRVCPKNVDYATQCPKGHTLVSFEGSGAPQAQQVNGTYIMCRVCHASTHARQWLVCSVTGCCGGYAVCAACASALRHADAGDSEDNDFPLEGVDVEYLQWLQTTFGASIGRATVEQVCQMYIRPRTSRSRGSVAKELADSAHAQRHVGPASWFVSHTWSNTFTDTLAAVLLFFEGREDAASAFMWLDFLVTPQHASAGPSKPSSWWMGTFKSSIARIGSLLLVVDVWDNPVPLKRAWCVLELHAIAMKKKEGGGRFAISMTTLEKQRFLTGIRDDPGAYFNMLGRVNVERSDCSRAADRESIHAGIRDSVGFGELGRMVFGVMEEWMVEELQAQVAEKKKNGDEREEMEWSCVLGNVLRDQGRLNEAVTIQEKALEISQRMLSDDNAGRGVHMNNLATTYGALGRHADALVMKESALEFRRRVLPPDHPDVVSSMNNLATTYGALGRHTDALAIQESATESLRRVLPPDHPDIVASMTNLAATFGALGRSADALLMQEIALDRIRRALPPDHPDIGNAMNNIAITFGDLGRHEDALAMGERALEFRRRVLPPDHPAIGTSLNNLAATYGSLGRHADALAMGRSALEFRRRVLPPDHPDIGTSLNNLAAIQRHFPCPRST